MWALCCWLDGGCGEWIWVRGMVRGGHGRGTRPSTGLAPLYAGPCKSCPPAAVARCGEALCAGPAAHHQPESCLRSTTAACGVPAAQANGWMEGRGGTALAQGCQGMSGACAGSLRLPYVQPAHGPTQLLWADSLVRGGASGPLRLSGCCRLPQQVAAHRIRLPQAPCSRRTAVRAGSGRRAGAQQQRPPPALFRSTAPLSRQVSPPGCAGATAASGTAWPGHRFTPAAQIRAPRIPAGPARKAPASPHKQATDLSGFLARGCPLAPQRAAACCCRPENTPWSPLQSARTHRSAGPEGRGRGQGRGGVATRGRREMALFGWLPIVPSVGAV